MPSDCWVYWEISHDQPPRRAAAPPDPARSCWTARPPWLPRAPGCPPRWCWCPPWVPCTTGTGPCSGPPVRSPAVGTVIVSVFVNPLQFRPGEDLDRYPRTLDEDLAMCASEGVRAVFVPSAADMYPGGQPEVTVNPGPVGRAFEGEFRPGFFDGVLTVVLKLFHLVRPDVAVFGEKDAQQLMLVRRMVSDTDLGITIASVPTVRDADGLATSSRNRYLSAADREQALALSGSLRAGQARAAEGLWPCRRPPNGSCTQSPRSRWTTSRWWIHGRSALLRPGLGAALIVVAAKVGATRLIDNMPVMLAADPGGHGTEGRWSDAARH